MRGMARPIYETRDDVQRELRIIKKVAASYASEFIHMPTTSVFDAVMHRRGKAVSLLEVKERFRRYDTLHIGKRKIDDICEVADFCSLPAFLAIQWPDFLGIVKLTPRAWPVVTGGRKDRNDAADIEQVYDIPVLDFAPVREVHHAPEGS